MEKYETLSQKHDIEDSDIAEIIDYIERHFNGVALIDRNVESRYDYFFKINGNIDILFLYHRVEIYIDDKFIFKADTKILKNEKVGILSYIRNLNK